MSKPKRRRWVCPECGEGRLAPSKMETMDPRRYCLKCSGDGRSTFVSLVCPALRTEFSRLEEKAEKQRLKRLEKNRRTQEKREKEKRERWTFEGHDLWPELTKIGEALNRKAPFRGVTFRWSKSKVHTSGSYGANGGVITFGSEAADAMSTLLWIACKGNRYLMSRAMGEIYNIPLNPRKSVVSFSQEVRTELKKLFPSPSPSLEGLNRERLLKLAEMGDKEATEALQRLDSRNNE